MTDTDAGAGATESAPEGLLGGDGPGIRILAQFIRDLSFENPRAPESLRGGAAQPQIDLGVEMNARGRDDGYYEVDLKLSAKANREDGPIFMSSCSMAACSPSKACRRKRWSRCCWWNAPASCSPSPAG